MSSSESSQRLLGDGKPLPPASKRLPAITLPFVSARALQALDAIEKFVEEECIPADPVYSTMLGREVEERFNAHPQIVEDLKEKAKKAGLWNMFLPKNHFKEGAGFSNLEYGLMAEILGKSYLASEVCTPNYSSSNLICLRRRTAQPQILAIWKYLPSTARRNRKDNGLTRCFRARFGLRS